MLKDQLEAKTVSVIKKYRSTGVAATANVVNCAGKIKSGRTITRESFTGLEKWCALAGNAASAPALIFGGEESYSRKGISVVGWKDAGDAAS